jgi:NADH dehydrogenase
LREAKVLARNIGTVIRRPAEVDATEPVKLEPFVYQTMGMLAALGAYNGVGRVGPFKVKGFLAWWVWRTYYVMQMTKWERRLRVILDWTVALLFRNDVVKLDLFGEQHPSERKEAQPAPPQPLGRANIPNEPASEGRKTEPVA